MPGSRPREAATATRWVEQRIDKRSMLTNKDRVEDVRDIMWQLEKDGEIVVHRIRDEHEPVTVKTLYGWDKRVPTTRLWHHKSCGQCGNIPGYPASLLVADESHRQGISRRDRSDVMHGVELSRLGHRQSSTAWPRCSCAISIRPMSRPRPKASRTAITIRWCIAAPRSAITRRCAAICLHSAELRERVKKILAKLGRLVDGKLLIPEEVVHYSEWAHVMRHEIAKHQVIDCSHIRATIHPACHVYKMVPEDAIYDDSILEGNRVAVSTGLMAGAGRAGDRLFHLVRLLRLRLPPHHLGARIHPLLRHRPQGPRRDRRGERRHHGRPRHRLHHHARQEPVDRQGGGQGSVAADPRRRAIRGAGVRRASLSHRAIALARLGHRNADGKAGHRLAGQEGRVRGLSGRGEDRATRTISTIRAGASPPAPASRGSKSTSRELGHERRHSRCRRRSRRPGGGACAGQRRPQGDAGREDGPARRRADPVALCQAGALGRMGVGRHRRHGFARREQPARST